MTKPESLEHLYRVCQELKMFTFSRYEWSLFHEHYLDFNKTMDLVASLVEHD